MRDGLTQRKSLDALGSPGGGDLLAWNAPYLFRIALEEGAIELLPEAIDQKVFKGVLRFALKQVRLDIAQADANGAPQAQALQCVRRERQRVIEERSHEVKAAFA